MEKIDFVVMKDNVPEGYHSAAIGVYLHGELEAEARYDISASSVDLRDLPTGIHQVTYNKEVECTLFFWVIKEYDYMRYRGLVVKNTDARQLEFAKRRFDEQAQFL